MSERISIDGENGRRVSFVPDAEGWKVYVMYDWENGGAFTDVSEFLEHLNWLRDAILLLSNKKEESA